MRGRKAKPAAVREAQGNPGRRPIAKPLADASAARGVVRPNGLSAPAAKVWDLLAPELQRLQFLRATDVQAFARYCMHLSRWWELTRDLKKEGETYLTESRHGKMLRLHPKFIVRERLENRMEGLEDRFGLSPSARQQVLQRMSVSIPTLPGLEQPSAEKKPEAEPAPAQSPVGMLGGARVH